MKLGVSFLLPPLAATFSDARHSGGGGGSRLYSTHLRLPRVTRKEAGRALGRLPNGKTRLERRQEAVTIGSMNDSQLLLLVLLLLLLLLLLQEPGGGTGFVSER